MICSALLITDDGRNSALGVRCDRRATLEYCGHAVCWLHWTACTFGPRSTGERERVGFVGKAAANG